MTLIGSQHGIDAWFNRMKSLDPGGANAQGTGAYDKLRRTLLILAEDHDAQYQEGGSATLSVPFREGSSSGTLQATVPLMGTPTVTVEESETSSTPESASPGTPPSQSSTESPEETNGSEN